MQHNDGFSHNWHSTALRQMSILTMPKEAFITQNTNIKIFECNITIGFAIRNINFSLLMLVDNSIGRPVC